MARRQVLLLVSAVALVAVFLPLAQAAPKHQNLGRIAFSSDRDDPNYDIYAVDPDGNNVDRLTNDPGVDWWPSWSPDGDTIAFQSTRDAGGDFDIYTMDTNGGHVKQLTANNNTDAHPRWSEDGKWIVFDSGRSGLAREIFVMRADGSDQTQVTHSPEGDYNTYPAFLDGGKIIYTHEDQDDDWTMRTIHKDGPDLRQLDVPATDVGAQDVTHRGGHRITFNNNLCACDDGPNSDIFVAEANGKKVKQLTGLSGDDGSDFYPRWAPDGRSITYTHFGTGPEAFFHEDVYTISDDGSNVFNVTDDGPDGADDWGPSWGCPGKGDCKTG
jgi:TolB protein